MHSLPYRAAYLVGLCSLIFKLKFENRCCGTLHIANHVQWNVCIGVLPICPWPNIDKLRDDLGSPRIDRTFPVGGQEIRVCHLLYNLQTWEAEVMLSWRPKSHQKKKKPSIRTNADLWRMRAEMTRKKENKMKVAYTAPYFLCSVPGTLKRAPFAPPVVITRQRFWFFMSEANHGTKIQKLMM